MKLGKISEKEVIGVLGGVLVGRFLFQSKSIMVLSAMGIAGGIIAHYMVKGKTDGDKYIQDVKDMVATEEPEAESNFYGTNREIEFNKQLGYATPNGSLTLSEPKDFMDINFNE